MVGLKEALLSQMLRSLGRGTPYGPKGHDIIAPGNARVSVGP